MIAEIEKPDGTYELKEMGDPVCGRDFCDTCGDCLECQPHDINGYCRTGSRWVIYLSNKLNPYYNEEEKR